MFDQSNRNDLTGELAYLDDGGLEFPKSSGRSDWSEMVKVSSGPATVEIFGITTNPAVCSLGGQLFGICNNVYEIAIYEQFTVVNYGEYFSAVVTYQTIAYIGTSCFNTPWSSSCRPAAFLVSAGLVSVGVCAASAMTACGIAVAVAYGFRAEMRIEKSGFKDSLGVNLADGIFTAGTFGLGQFLGADEVGAYFASADNTRFLKLIAQALLGSPSAANFFGCQAVARRGDDSNIYCT